MLKKILYSIVTVVVGFLMFYLSWNSACENAINNKSRKAIANENFEFFEKMSDYYKNEPSYVGEYTLEGNTTKLVAYEVCGKYSENKKTTNKSGYLFIIYNLNLDVVQLDDEDSSSITYDSEDPATRVTFTADNGEEYIYPICTYGYDKTPVFYTSIVTSKGIEKLSTETSTATKIVKMKITDPEEFVIFEDTINLDLVEHNDTEYWDNLVETNIAGLGYTNKERRKLFLNSYPEMGKVWLVTGITLLICGAIGAFFFWPKKSHVPDREELEERFTFASTEDKNKTAIERIARDKREKEERENRYKNVRANNNNTLENLSDELVEKSLEDPSVVAVSDIATEPKEENSEIIDAPTNEDTVEETNKEE